MDDDDELAELRAQRAARTGQVTLSELQRRAAAVQENANSVYQNKTSRNGHAVAVGSSGTLQDHHDGDDGDGDGDLDTAPAVEYVVDEADPVDDPVWQHLPLSFGKQEIKAVKPVDAHQKTQRQNPSIGPPRPPSKQQQQQQPLVGPPRPPGVGPPRPPAAQALPEGPPKPPSSRGGWMTAEEVIGQQQQQQRQEPPAAAADTADDDGGSGGWELMGPSRPPADAAGAGSSGADEPDMVGPPRPPASSGSHSDSEGDEDDEDDYEAGGGAADADRDPYQLPITHEVTLQGHDRAVTCLDIEHSGNRLISGSMDYTLRIFDFNGMKADLRSFRELTPSDGHPVLAVSWSPTGDAFLCVTGSAQPKVYDRDGKLRGEFDRGDMYIRDMKNTKGHITACTGGCWHPTDRFTAVTCSQDGTVRVWDAHNIMQKTVVRPSNPSAARVAVTTCSYNSTGGLLAAGLEDGTIQVWGVGGKFGTSAAVGVVLPPSAQMVEKQGWTYVSRPNQLLRGAHQQQYEITSLAFSQDDKLLASRCMDGTLKLWDLRKFKQPLAAWDDLPTNYPTTNTIFSPDECLLLTGIAAGAQSGAAAAPAADDAGAGAVVLMDVRELKEVRRVGMPSHVAALRWHSRLNQIFVGVGNKRGGATHVLYDTAFSEKGVLSAVGRAPRKPNPFDIGLPLVIKTPHALPMFREEPGRKRSREKARLDPVKSRKPDPGATAGMGRAGRIGTTGGTLLTQHLLKTRGKLVSVAAEMDPRDAILRHGDKKDDAISRLTEAYSKTQPKPMFAEPDPEDEEEEEEQ